MAESKDISASGDNTKEFSKVVVSPRASSNFSVRYCQFLYRLPSSITVEFENGLKVP